MAELQASNDAQQVADSLAEARLAPSGGPHAGPPLPPTVLAGFVIAVVAIVLIATLFYTSLQARTANVQAIERSQSVVLQLERLLSLLKDAEAGQRGYLLVGEEAYLQPYTDSKAALGEQFALLRNLASDDPSQKQRLGTLTQLAVQKMEELGQTIAMHRAGNTAGAMDVVRTDRGKVLMDRIRTMAAEIGSSEQDLLAKRQAEWRQSERISLYVIWGGSALLLLLVLIAATMSSRDYRARQLLIWLRSGQMGLTTRLQGEQRLETLGDHVLDFLSGYLDAQVGALYVADGKDRFRRVAGHALAPGEQQDTLRSGESLLGQAAKSGRAMRVRNLPDDYLPISSALGQGKPRELLVAPARINGRVHAVLELGFLRRIRPEDELLMERVSDALGIAVRSSKDRTRLEELLEETQRQAEQLQTQQEELRVSNEELEEQGRALKESQAQLESQQAELEQTNAQLEEQTQILEAQRDELARSQVDLSNKAEDLERASQYKNEFLANMSHELRTPLNSSLILSKLLADNKDGNLTPEQVEFAETISSAGNDLLALINDILDLSKIEAGKVEIVPERVFVKATVEALVKSVQPLAEEKGLTLSALVDPGTPERFETDAGRLAQILKNLLSNALKFTQHGEVSLRAYAGTEAGICFAVTDTGIGIPAHQQELIFEAFRQADGSTHRKYGGTGLGLSISRDLSRLLGGDITVQSIVGQGSTFTLSLPLAYAGAKEPVAAAIAHAAHAHAHRAEPAPAAPASIAHNKPAQPLRSLAIEDDRDLLSDQSRLILVIEDDPRFAGILRDLAHEMSFHCVAAHTASEGLAAAARYRPSAIVLDINLPDHSGLGVLDQLKRDPATRHIPVHVVSVVDYSHEALELGAVGYALKPVKREQLVEAFKKLDAKLSQGMRHVLVVEDDARQRESIRLLLGNRDVQITDVPTASAALAELHARTFDCMVMDLNLPDLSGYELLERMAEQGDVAFPPVIVYTGRSLTRDEEQRLRRFSRSIIIKDARSPERLLDEVTLFLHQVESDLPEESQRILKSARARESSFEGRRILVVEDDARNIFALASVFEPKGAEVAIARNGREALQALEKRSTNGSMVDLVLMDIMMPEMDGLTAMREIRKRPEWRKLPIIALTAKAMKDDQERCLAAGANDYIAKPLDVERLLSLVRVWMPK